MSIASIRNTHNAAGVPTAEWQGRHATCHPAYPGHDCVSGCVRHVLLVLALGGLAAVPCSGQANDSSIPLPISGTMSLNFAYSWVPPRPAGWPSDTKFVGTRFGGRIAVLVTRSMRIGFAVASWEVSDVQGTSCTGGQACEKLLPFHGQAVATTAFAQWQVGYAVFRGGMGLVRSTRDLPGEVGRATEGLIRRRGADRFGISAGGGINVPVGRHIYLTPSVDLVWMPTISAASQELRWAVLMGLGLTVQ